MNLVFHHFRKEARYLAPRWWLWVGVLIVELMLNLEWIAPMTVRGNAWPAYAMLVSWALAVVMVLTQAPEDGAAATTRFTATRPLPASSYWLGRVLIFLVMIVLPFVVQQGVYLTLSHRPLGEVLSGMNTQALRVIGALGWVVPLSALWRGWRWVVATVLSTTGLVMVLQWMSDRPYASADSILFVWHFGLGVVAIGLAATVAWANRRWEWGISRKLAAHVASIFVLAWLCRHWQVRDWNDTAVDLPQAEALAKQATISFPPEGLSAFKPRRIEDGAFMVSGEATIQGLPPNATVSLYPRHASAQMAGVEVAMHSLSPIPDYLPTWLFFELTGQLEKRTRAIQTNLPAGTILSMPTNATFVLRGTSAVLAAFDDPVPDPTKPLSIVTDLDLVWQDWKSLIEIPVRAGSLASSPNARWTILNVRFDEGLVGRPVPGAVTVDYRVECRGGIESVYETGLRLLLYSPDRRIAWTPAASMREPDMRAITTGWTRRIGTTTWDNVLRYADGESIEMNRDHLKLIVLEPRHLGTTRWQWKSPPITLADHVSKDDSWNYTTDEGLYDGRQHQVFEQRIASLAMPAPNASKKDVIRYVFEVFSVAATMKFDPKAPPPRLREVLSAVAKDHLAVMLEMSDSMASQWADLLAEILTPQLSDVHKADLVSQLPGRAWLAPIVTILGWAKDAVPALMPVLRGTQPIDIHLIKLVLLASDDDAVLHLLLENFRHHPNRGYEIIDHLVRRPSMRAEVKAVADELWAGFDPTLQIKQDNRLRIAIKFGNAAALDYALRLAALGGEQGGDQWRLVFDLPDLLGLPRKPKDAKIADLAPSYRHLKASDFEYQPDKMLWKKKS